VWNEVESLIALRNPGGYGKATALLRDLRDLAREQDTDGDFHQRISELRARHGSKPRLIERLTAGGVL
jgi:hypothetical protein